MSVIKPEDQRPKLERMASHWPRNLQEHWHVDERRRFNLPATLLSESIRLGSGSRVSTRSFGKRKSYLVPPC